MQTFNIFFKIVKKHISMIITYVIIFAVIATVISSFGSENDKQTFSASKSSIAVFDHDNSDYSRALYDYLEKTQNIVSVDEDKESFSDSLYYNVIDYVLIIQDGFEDDFSLIQNIKYPGSINAHFIDDTINHYLKAIDSYKAAGLSCTDCIKYANETIDTPTEVNFVSTNTITDEKSNITYFFQYLPYVLCAVVIVGLGNILAIFRKKEINDRIQCSCMPAMKQSIYLSIASVVFCVAVLMIFLILAVILYKTAIFNVNGALKILNVLVFLLFALSLTYFLSFFAHTSNTLNIVGNTIALSLSFLGGVFVPLSLFGEGISTVAKFLPTYWYIMANDLTEVFSGTAEQITRYFSYIGIEFLFAAALFAAALATAKLKQKEA